MAEVLILHHRSTPRFMEPPFSIASNPAPAYRRRRRARFNRADCRFCLCLRLGYHDIVGGCLGCSGHAGGSAGSSVTFGDHAEQQPRVLLCAQARCHTSPAATTTGTATQADTKPHRSCSLARDIWAAVTSLFFATALVLFPLKASTTATTATTLPYRSAQRCCSVDKCCCCCKVVCRSAKEHLQCPSRSFIRVWHVIGFFAPRFDPCGTGGGCWPQVRRVWCRGGGLLGTMMLGDANEGELEGEDGGGFEAFRKALGLS